MSSVAEIGQAIKSVLSTVADEVARETGFTERESKLTGAKFAQTTVLVLLPQLTNSRVVWQDEAKRIWLVNNDDSGRPGPMA